MSKAFDVETNRRFMTKNANNGEYLGSVNSDLLLLLTRPFLGQNILDAGAGDGTLVKTIRDSTSGTQVKGVDLVPKNDDVEQGDLTQLHYDSATFDTLICSEVIEHMPPDDSRKTLGELTRVLQPGGHLILTTPFDEQLADKMVHCPHCDNAFHRVGHQQSFTEDDFRELAAMHGLEVVDLFAIRYPRLRRFQFLGKWICRSRWFKNWMKQTHRKRHLVLVGKKTMKTASNVPTTQAA